VHVDIIDDRESSVTEGLLDFTIDNRFIEHTHNPIGTVWNHISQVKKGGNILRSSNPEYNFDRE